jgi:NitT/TauT family transport system ATP-binding protein
MNLELLRIWEARRKTVVMVTHSIQEAVFLADRVLVMSPLPGRIETAVSVSLPRPRQLAMLYSQEFGSLSQQIRRAIHPVRVQAVSSQELPTDTHLQCTPPRQE